MPKPSAGNVGPSSGYSGTPLPRKLGIGPGTRVHLIGAPAAFRALIEPLPEGATIVSRMSRSTDLVHVFSTDLSDLSRRLNHLRTAMRPDAAVWVSWPKKAARVATDLTEDVIRRVALPLGFVDVKVCAVDEIWSGLKLVIRRELRPR